MSEEKLENNEVKESTSGNQQEGQSQEYKWYALRIISGHERKVKQYLENEIKQENLSDKIKNVILPEEKVFEVKSGKKKVKLKNFLPGYLLIEAQLDDEVKAFIKKAPSILNVVGTKRGKEQKLEPIPLRPDEVKRLKMLLSEENQTEKIDLRLNIGDPVKVISGPFNNFSGNVLEIYPEKMKVKVMVSIFGRKTPIELEFTQIEKEK